MICPAHHFAFCIVYPHTPSYCEGSAPHTPLHTPLHTPPHTPPHTPSHCVFIETNVSKCQEKTNVKREMKPGAKALALVASCVTDAIRGQVLLLNHLFTVSIVFE